MEVDVDNLATLTRRWRSGLCGPDVEMASDCASKTYSLRRIQVRWIPLSMSKHHTEEIQLAVELSEILWDFWLLKQPMAEFDNVLENMRQQRFMQLLIESLILRLCKFRDTDTRSLSFDQAIKSLRKRAAGAGRVEGLATQVEQYRKITQNLEKHRDNRIAHLAKSGRDRLKPAVEIGDAVRMAVKIVDAISGDRVVYRAFGVNLRAELAV